MPDKCCQANQRKTCHALLVKRRGDCRKRYSQHTFAGITEQGPDRRFAVTGAQHIGCTRVA